MLESPHFAGRGFEGQAPVVTEVLARRIQPLLSAKLVHFPAKKQAKIARNASSGKF